MSSRASRSPDEPVVLLATATGCWELDEDAEPLTTELRAAGLESRAAVWDDPTVDWAAAELVVVRSTWDYPLRRGEFLAWAERVEVVSDLANSADVLRWNTDKRYLGELAESGVPVVRTDFLDPAELDAPRAAERVRGAIGEMGEVVVKPSVSIGSRDTARFTAIEADAACDLAAAILAGGRTVMVQPYVSSVDERGETGLVYFDGTFSHAFNKAALLEPGGATEHGVFALESIEPHEATDEERARGREVLAEAVAILGATPLYARVDLVGGVDGPELLELELTEPSWFLSTDEAAATRAAAAIARRIGTETRVGPANEQP